MGDMNMMKTVGLILMAGGILGLAYGGFSFTKETHQAQVGPLTISVQDRQEVNIPIWLGVTGLVLGGALLMVGFKRS